MNGLTGHLDAARTDRSAPVRRDAALHPITPLCRAMVHHALQEARKTRHGLPTDGAIEARVWIEEYRPAETDRAAYELSFAFACYWAGYDAEAKRKRLVRLIDKAWMRAWKDGPQMSVYRQRAAVVSCGRMLFAGTEPARVGRQYVLPLVSEAEFEDVAGVVRPDPKGWRAKMRPLRAA